MSKMELTLFELWHAHNIKCLSWNYSTALIIRRLHQSFWSGQQLAFVFFFLLLSCESNSKTGHRRNRLMQNSNTNAYIRKKRLAVYRLFEKRNNWRWRFYTPKRWLSDINRSKHVQLNVKYSSPKAHNKKNYVGTHLIKIQLLDSILVWEQNCCIHFLSLHDNYNWTHQTPNVLN